jgi:hypothetical protein
MPDVYPPYIFGMHDRGGEHLMQEKGRRGWVLVTEAVGADPNNHSGSDYTDLTNKGLGVISRLNNGYGTAGTIPVSAQYDDFARRCGNFVQASPGCDIWIIGNEMNLAWERPGGPDGQVITPELYAECFRKCRAEIHRRPGHGEDQVVVGATGPWNTQTRYPTNQNGDWVKYFADILNLLGGEVDGISIHTYTHGQDPNLVFSEATMNPPFASRHWHFRAYRDFMGAIPGSLRNRPVYITETDQYASWRDENTGWVRNAYKEINDWNQDSRKQPIQALVLFRWIIGNPNDPQQVGWAIENKPAVQDDFRDAMNNQYQVVLPETKPEYRVAWLEVNAPTVLQPGVEVSFSVRVRNDGRRTWASTGTQAVRLGYHWLTADGGAIEGVRTNLPRPVAAGQTITVTGMTVRAPETPGFYILEIDLVEGASGWFADEGSPVWQREGIRVGARYRASWLSVAAPSAGRVGETVIFPVRVRNEGSLTWPPSGPNPVNLTYKWLDANRNVVVADGLRTPIGREVAPLQDVTLDANLQFPAESGLYILQMDMVHEFVVWFHWKGSPVYEAQVTVVSALPDYAAEWLRYMAPERLAAGQLGSAYVEVKNVGAKPWPRSGAEAIRLGYRWLDAQGQEVPVDGAETRPLPRTVESGGVATLSDVPFLTPGTTGTYRLVWDLKKGGDWLSNQGVAVAEHPMQIIPPEYVVEWQVLESFPAQMLPGQEQHASLRLRNIGTRTWASGGEHPVHLAYHWFTNNGKLSEPWDTFRTQLPATISPGSEVDLLDIPFKTPALPGAYVLRWDLVEEGQTWFFRQGGAPLEVAVEISDRSSALSVPWQVQASHNALEASLSIDGNPDTAWDSKIEQQPGMWFQLDLGQTLVLDRAKISSPGRGFPVGYQVKVSADGQDWHLVAEQAQNWADVDVAFAPCQARYLRLEQTGQPDWPASWMISEIAVSVARPWAGAQASHYAGDATRAIDAHLQTAWNTRSVKQKPAMWFVVDMGSPRQIERVTLEHPNNEYPRGFVVEISPDGQTWQPVGHSNDNWNRVDVQFPPATAVNVRVRTTRTSDYYAWGIAAFVVWRSAPSWLRGTGS